MHKEHWFGRSPREQHEQGEENVGFRGFHVAPACFSTPIVRVIPITVISGIYTISSEHDYF